MTAETPPSVRVFINATGVNVSAGASILEAVRTWSAAEAAAVTRGEKLVTDSRGLPIETDQPVSAGSIFRLLPVRKREPGVGDSGLED